MLPGLRHYSLIGSYDKNNKIYSADSRKHVFYEFLMARNIYYTDVISLIIRDMCKTKLNRNSSLLLLRKSVGINARECLSQLGLAVIDMSCRSDNNILHYETTFSIRLPPLFRCKSLSNSIEFIFHYCSYTEKKSVIIYSCNYRDTALSKKSLNCLCGAAV